MGSKVWWKSLVLAGPVLLFPVSRAYYVFYVAIIAWALWEARSALWKEERAITMALAAFALPVLVTFFALAVSGHTQWVLLQRGGTFILGALLALATVRLSRNEDSRGLAVAMMGVAIGSWLLDGSVQLLLGHAIDCRGGETPCVTDPRVSLYFANNTKLSYFVGMMVFIPAAWLIARRRHLLAGVVLLAGGVLSMAMGSRFGLLSFLVGLGALGLVVALGMGRVTRLAIFGVAPVLLIVLGTVFYHVNPAFHARMASTLLIFSGSNYDVANQALSGRLDIWVPTLHMLAVDHHWLFGVGPGNLDTAVRPYLQPGNLFASIKIFHAHQVLIDILAATGVVGLLAFLAYYGWAVRTFLRLRWSDIDVRWAGLLIFVLMWFPFNSAQGFYSSEMVFLSFFMLGLGFGFRSSGQSASSVSSGEAAAAAPSHRIVV